MQLGQEPRTIYRQIKKCDNEQIDVGEYNLRLHVKADNMEIVNFDLDAKIINLKQKLNIDKPSFRYVNKLILNYLQ